MRSALYGIQLNAALKLHLSWCGAPLWPRTLPLKRGFSSLGCVVQHRLCCAVESVPSALLYAFWITVWSLFNASIRRRNLFSSFSEICKDGAISDKINKAHWACFVLSCTNRKWNEENNKKINKNKNKVTNDLRYNYRAIICYQVIVECRLPVDFMFAVEHSPLSAQSTCLDAIFILVMYATWLDLKMY